MWRSNERDGQAGDGGSHGDGASPGKRTLTGAIVQRRAAEPGATAAAAEGGGAAGPAAAAQLDDPFDFTFGQGAAAEEAEGDRDNNDGDPEIPAPPRAAADDEEGDAGGDEGEDEPSEEGAEQEEEERISDEELAAEIAAQSGGAPEEVAGPAGGAPAPAQARAGVGGLDHDADLPAASTGAPLDGGVRSTMEHAFQTDFSGVQVHADSPRAASLGALAYTEGNSVHMAPGQYAPDSHGGRELIGHELAHVVQQREGRVAATGQAKGLAVNEDPALEHEADALGRRAAGGEVVYRSAALGMRDQVGAVQMARPVLQMARTHSGNFTAKPYHSLRSGRKGVGVEIAVRFKPGRRVDAKQIAMVQAVRTAEAGAPIASANVQVAGRSISSGDAQPLRSAVGTDEGFHIDQSATNRNPLYAVEGAPATDTRLDQGPTTAPVRRMNRQDRRAQANATGVSGQTHDGWGEHGFRFKDNGKWKSKTATLHDAPNNPARTKNAEQLFETTALATDGTQNGTYYGSVQWGWRTNDKGRFRRLPFRVISQGVPTSTFMKAAQIWNPGTTSGGDPNLALPVVDVHVLTARTRLNPGVQGRRHTRLRRGTRVEVLDPAVAMPDGRTLARIRVVDGSRTGVEGLVLTTVLQDERA